jgi:hypothetical protein
MHPVALTPDQVCGRCLKFEPSRDPKYGYCRPLMALEAERSPYPKTRLLDVDHLCVMVVWHGNEQRPAFVAKETP